MGRHGRFENSNRPITFESNRNGRFEIESNLEASQVPTSCSLVQPTQSSTEYADELSVCRRPTRDYFMVRQHGFIQTPYVLGIASIGGHVGGPGLCPNPDQGLSGGPQVQYLS